MLVIDEVRCKILVQFCIGRLSVWTYTRPNFYLFLNGVRLTQPDLALVGDLKLKILRLLCLVSVMFIQTICVSVRG